MKQGKLIRRAVSAALAGCMMFTLSAPALAESTDALMQLSTAAKSAVCRSWHLGSVFPCSITSKL